MIKQKQIRDSLVSKLSRYFGMSPAEAGEEQIYKATVLTVRDILAQKNRAFSERVKAGEQKRVYYICLEFLVGRSLRLNLNNPRSRAGVPRGARRPGLRSGRDL